MQQWEKISLILCTFGLLKELRPSESFITEYIIDFKNVTAEELIHVAFPVSTYSALGTIAVVFLITDWLRYRPVVIFEGFIYIATWLILIISTDLPGIIVVEICYGIACSTEVAYYVYIYAQVDKKHYKKVTSHTSSALHAGKLVGGLLGQLLLTMNAMDYHQMTFLTLGFSVIGFIATLFLPKVKRSIYFHHIENQWNQKEILSLSLSDENAISLNSKEPLKSERLSGFRILISHLTEAYSNMWILKWSLWWALASAGQYQVINYIQALWEKINEEKSLQPYNGMVKALHTFLSMILCFGVGYLKLEWSKWGEICLGGISLAQGTMLIWMANSTHLYTSYFSYTIFRTIHPVILTIACSEVAQGISHDSHGLIFGMNTFLALILQTILTLIVSDKQGFAFDVQMQFVIYGGFFVSLGVLFLFAFVWSLLSSVTNCANNDSPKMQLKCDNNSSPVESVRIMVANRREEE